jgi:hypothetical protein
MGFVVDKAALGQVFSTLIIRGWYNRPVIASIIVDSIPLHPKKRRKTGSVCHFTE